MKTTAFVICCLATGCTASPPPVSAPSSTSDPAIEPSTEAPVLSPEAMEDLARSTLHAAHPEASLDALSFRHHGFPDAVIESPLQHHRCWAGFVGESPLSGVPDMDYLCVSDTGHILYPYTPADFKLMLADEDLSTWGDEEYFQASKLYIHLYTPTRQHAGWVWLSSGADFLAIEFNMPSDSLEARQDLASRIQPARRIESGDQQMVELYTWSNIGGPVHHWTLGFSEAGLEESHIELGRFGGGGYD